MECTKNEIYFLVETLRRNSMKAVDVYNIIRIAWPEKCLSVVQIRRLMRQFGTGDRETFYRQNGSGRRKSERRLRNIDNVQRCVEQNGNMTVNDMADNLDISHTMVQRILEEDLDVMWYHTKWVPHTLSEANKAVRVDRCNELIDSLQTRSSRLNLVTVDEKFFYCRKIKPANRIGTWLTERAVASGYGPCQTPLRSTMEKKFMVIVAVSQIGRHYFEMLEQKETITAKRYINFLQNMINFFQKGNQKILSENMVLMHDNARPHIARDTIEFLASKNVRLLRQPPYSPDTNICDNYLFKRLEASRANLKNVDDIRSFLNEELTKFTSARMDKALDASVEIMMKIIETGGCYV